MAESPPEKWLRGTKWQQGSVLPRDAAAALELAHPTHPADTRVVVIGHDCDVANDNLRDEPDVEVIVGRLLSAADPNYTRTKSVRKLHLEFQARGGIAAIELSVTAKASVPKDRLASWEPDPGYDLDRDNVVALQHWLSVRYKRAAFPDEFNTRMKRLSLVKQLEAIANAHNAIISAIYFALEPREELSADDPAPYKLTITVLYMAGDDPEESADDADKAVAAIDGAFRKRCFDKETDTWKGIELVDVIAASDDDLTVKHERLLQQWRLEHHSLRPGTESAPAPGLKA
jgi:hypothetical protein